MTVSVMLYCWLQGKCFYCRPPPPSRPSGETGQRSRSALKWQGSSATLPQLLLVRFFFCLILNRLRRRRRRKKRLALRLVDLPPNRHIFPISTSAGRSSSAVTVPSSPRAVTCRELPQCNLSVLYSHIYDFSYFNQSILKVSC